MTDVPVANHGFATDGYMVSFSNGTSMAAPQVSYLAARILAALPDATVDLVRALIINCAAWPSRLDGDVDNTLRVLGYGVPRADRALAPGGPRCITIIEDEIRIGHAQYFRVPFPTHLFEQARDLMIRVSVTLAYRASVRKTNRKYRATVLQWDLAKPGEALQQLRSRFSTAPAEADEADDDVPEQPTGDWPWVLGPRRRTRGTAQKDWFDTPAHRLGDELLLAVAGRRGWLSKQQQDDGFVQRYAVALCVEAIGSAIPIPLHEVIEAMVQVPVVATV
jgi:hypothetical protein